MKGGPTRKLGCQMGVRVLAGGGGPGQRRGTPVSLTWQCPRRGWQRWHPRTRLSTARQRAGSGRAFRECPAPAQLLRDGPELKNNLGPAPQPPDISTVGCLEQAGGCFTAISRPPTCSKPRLSQALCALGQALPHSH